MHESYFPIINACKDRCDRDDRLNHLRAAVAGYTGMELGYINPQHVASFLTTIIDGTATRHDLLHTILKEIDPDPFYGFMKDERPYWERVCTALCGIIAMTKVSDIPGYREWHTKTFPDYYKEKAE